jgi:hypothetical protein
MTHRSLTSLALAAALLGGATGASAQDKKEQERKEKVRVETIVSGSGDQEVVIEERFSPADGPGDNTFVFVSNEMSFGGKTVKGAPYSAQAVTETVQTLGDGNRIVRRNAAQVYRDSEGRTRRDQTIGAIGPFAHAGDPPQTFFINDPVANVNYVLDPRTKTARKLARLEFKVRTENKESAGVQEKSLPRRQAEVEARGFVFSTPAVPAPPPPAGGPGEPLSFFYSHSSKAETKTEKLDKRVIEGVEAEGFRTVTTIPAGEIGNEQPIEIVHERWYSPELQTVVMTRHSDPRMGETTYKLTGISRAEPAASLFQVPGDYTIKEAMSVRRMRRPAPPANEN